MGPKIVFFSKIILLLLLYYCVIIDQLMRGEENTHPCADDHLGNFGNFHLG